MAQSLNLVRQQTVRVTGKGETQQKAFANALSQIQKRVVQNEAYVTLQITPLKVKPVSLNVETYKERFLFLFFPRVRTTYVVTIDVDVAVNAIELATVPFKPVARPGAELKTFNALKGGK